MHENKDYLSHFLIKTGCLIKHNGFMTRCVMIHKR